MTKKTTEESIMVTTNGTTGAAVQIAAMGAGLAMTHADIVVI